MSCSESHKEMICDPSLGDAVVAAEGDTVSTGSGAEPGGGLGPFFGFMGLPIGGSGCVIDGSGAGFGIVITGMGIAICGSRIGTGTGIGSKTIKVSL